MTFAGGVNSADHAHTFPTLVNLLRQQVIFCGIPRACMSKLTLCKLPQCKHETPFTRTVYLGNQQQHSLGFHSKSPSLKFASPLKGVLCMSSVADVACLADTQ